MFLSGCNIFFTSTKIEVVRALIVFGMIYWASDLFLPNLNQLEVSADWSHDYSAPVCWTLNHITRACSSLLYITGEFKRIQFHFLSLITSHFSAQRYLGAFVNSILSEGASQLVFKFHSWSNQWK